MNKKFKRCGYIYIIECDERNAVKIGCSRNPKERINGIKTISSIKGKEWVSEFIEDYYTFETLIHNSLYMHNRSHEWFNLSFEDAIDKVNEILANATVIEKGKYFETLATNIKDQTSKIVNAFEDRFFSGDFRTILIRAYLTGSMEKREAAKQLTRVLHLLGSEHELLQISVEKPICDFEMICTIYFLYLGGDEVAYSFIEAANSDCNEFINTIVDEVKTYHSDILEIVFA